jgi:prepilin-type N-terminal cleavage/methylation domain-containing protein
MNRKGFTLIEFLISLSLLLIIVLAGFEFFGQARALFFKLKEAEESEEAALAALDKIRIDLARGGRGLAVPIGMGLLEAVRADPERLTVLSSEGSYGLREDLAQGGTRAALESADGLKKGSEICIFDPDKGEVRRVLSVEGECLTLSTPLEHSYSRETAGIVAVERTSFFLDREDAVIRRQVNSSPAQPLLEDAGTFLFSYDRPRNLAGIAFTLASHKEKTYELCIFPKNAGLSLVR